MKDLLILLVICSTTHLCLAQEKAELSAPRIYEVHDRIRTDSLQQKIFGITDSFQSLQKLDSIRLGFNETGDSIKSQYENTIRTLTSKTRKTNNTIDSLTRLSLPLARYTKSLDSLNNALQTTKAQLTSRLEALKSKTIDKLNALDLPPEYKEPLQSITRKVDGLDLNSEIIKIPELDIPGYSIPDVKGLDGLTTKAGDIGKIGNPGSLSEIENPVGNLTDLSGQAKVYQEDIKNITEGNLNDVQALPERIEEQASKIDGMDELQKASGGIDEHKAKVDQLADPKNVKEKAKDLAKKAAVDHFAGKQEQLKSAMDKISKYKQKYSSVSSIRDLPKRPPNPMKGKPFIERLVPGLYLQYQRRLTSGLGWNHRYSYDHDNRTFPTRSRIFGPRGYVDFKLGKGFIAHVEEETMNSFVPSTLLGNPDNGHREWVWSFMTGIKKEYKIYKNLKETALIQYNLFNRYYKAPYVDRLNSRIGFEYVLKKKKGKGK